jgi:hypothetical protein
MNRVRSKIYDGIWFQIKGRVWSEVFNQVMMKVEDQVELQVRERIRVQVESQVWRESRDVFSLMKSVIFLVSHLKSRRNSGTKSRSDS